MPEAHRTAEPQLQDMLARAARDGAAWIDAELTLARASASAAASYGVSAAVLALTGVAAMFAALVVLAHAAVIALAPYAGGFHYAAIVVGLVLLLLASALGLAALKSARSTRRQFDFVKRWKP